MTKTIATYESYNARRYSNPWVAEVSDEGRPDFTYRVGGFTGEWNSGDAGEIYVQDPVEGKVYAWGQKDYRGGHTQVHYTVYLQGEFYEIERRDIIDTIRADLADLIAKYVPVVEEPVEKIENADENTEIAEETAENAEEITETDEAEDDEDEDENENDPRTRIYCADLTPASVDGEYEWAEATEERDARTEDGPVAALGEYVTTMIFESQEPLGMTEEYDGRIHNLPDGAYVVTYKGIPRWIYWAEVPTELYGEVEVHRDERTCQDWFDARSLHDVNQDGKTYRAWFDARNLRVVNQDGKWYNEAVIATRVGCAAEKRLIAYDEAAGQWIDLESLVGNFCFRYFVDPGENENARRLSVC